MKKLKIDVDGQIINKKMKVVFTVFSRKNFFWRMYISRFVLEKECAPINPFMNFEYFLFDGADRNEIIRATNNIIKKCDEVWVFGDVSDGVYCEIQLAKKLNKPIRFFQVSGMPFEANEINENGMEYEEGFVPDEQVFE